MRPPLRRQSVIGTLTLWLFFGCNAVLDLEPLETPLFDDGGTGGTGAGTAPGVALAPSAGVASSLPAGNGGAPGVGMPEKGGESASVHAAGANDGGANTAGEAGMGSLAGAGGALQESCPLPSEVASLDPSFTLRNSCWRTSASDCGVDTPELALDGKLDTRFSTGVYMEPGTAFEYRIDLRSVVDVTRVVLTSMANDAARQLSVYVSEDGETWRAVACGPGELVTDFWFESTKARYLRFVQGGTAPGWWSLHELAVYGDGQDTCGGYVGIRWPGECDVTHEQP
jgi:hypothetical protein